MRFLTSGGHGAHDNLRHSLGLEGEGIAEAYFRLARPSRYPSGRIRSSRVPPRC